MKTNIFNRITQITALLAAAAAMTGCGWVKEDIPACPAQLRLKFVYDYNMKYADAFHHEVKSIDVWAFDSRSGAPVWKGEARADELPDEAGYTMETPLDAGSYDFVAWCGLSDESPMKLAGYTPSSKEDLKVALQTAGEGEAAESSVEIPGLYHGAVSHTYTPDPQQPSLAEVTVPLTKDTNAIRVLLQNIDGTEINRDDFTVTLTGANSLLDHDNSVMAGPTVTYSPWMTSYGVIGTDSRAGDIPESITTVATLMNEFSTSRLIAGAPSTLTVRRNSDGADVVRIPLIDYLLLIKGHYGNMGDQEYLDRQDDYSILFFLDHGKNWYVAGGIYINSWAVVPPQNEDL